MTSNEYIVLLASATFSGLINKILKISFWSVWWWCVCFLWICMLEKVTHVSGRLLPFHTWAVFPPVKLPWLHLKKKQTQNQWINNKNRTFRTINISVPVFLPLFLSPSLPLSHSPSLSISTSPISSSLPLTPPFSLSLSSSSPLSLPPSFSLSPSSSLLPFSPLFLPSLTPSLFLFIPLFSNPLPLSFSLPLYLSLSTSPPPFRPVFLPPPPFSLCLSLWLDVFYNIINNYKNKT